jgi:predicted nuclease of predicted toxin-antitoxin system
MPWITLDTKNVRVHQRRNGQVRVRFLVDESLGVDAVRVLQETGWNAKFVADLGLAGKDDTMVFAAAWKQRRVILTHDRDFLDNRNFPPHRNPGVVVFVVGASGEDDERLLRAFFLMQEYLKVFGQAYMIGTKIVFSDDEHLSIERKRAGSIRTARYWMPRTGEALEWLSE